MLTVQFLITLEILYYTTFVTIFWCAFKPLIDADSPKILRG